MAARCFFFPVKLSFLESMYHIVFLHRVKHYVALIKKLSLFLQKGETQLATICYMHATD
jgi:hypothetical protein